MESTPSTRSRRLASRRWLRCVRVAIACGAIVGSGAAHAQLAARQVDRGIAPALRVGGSDSIHGLGDWVLSNGVLCAAVLGVENEGQLITTGGNLVDLGHCGRDDDQFLGLEPLYNLSRNEILPVERIRAEVGSQRAQIITEAAADGLVQETRYALDLSDPTRILITTRIERTGDGARFFAFAELLQNVKSSIRNFVLNRSGPSEGFHHISLEESEYFEIARAIRRAESIVLIGSDAQGPPIAYAYRPLRAELQQSEGDEPRALGHYTLAMESVTVTSVLVDPLWFDRDSLGPLQALQGLLMDLDVGDVLVFEREIRVSRHADVAQFSDAIFRARGGDAVATVRGRVDDPDARLHFEAMPEQHAPMRGQGPTSPVTMARPRADGSFAVVLPHDHYRLRARGPAGRTHDRIFRLPDPQTSGEEPQPAQDALDLGTLKLSRSARVLLPTGAPMRLVFRGDGGTPDPVFGSDLTGLTVHGEPFPTSSETHDVHLAGVASDPKYVDVPPGRYRVYATHGLEFSVTESTIELAGGDSKQLEIAAPQREIETPGWVSADFHVHSSASFDSTLGPDARVRSFAAEGTEVLVASEHDVVGDLRPAIERMGLRDQIHDISGVEVTTVAPNPVTPHTSGHSNVFPVRRDPLRNRGGAIPGEARRLREIIADARRLPTNPVVQLNHPRNPFIPLHDEALFDHLAVPGRPFDPSRAIDAAPNEVLVEKDPESGLRDIDFDAIELMNGKRVPFYLAVRRDWFSLLRQGFVSTGTANSDSHSLGRVVGVPRNYVRVAQDPVQGLDQEAFVAAVRNGELCGTTGPFVAVRLGDATPGRRFEGDRGTLRVDIRSASWVPLSHLRVYVDGEVVHDVAIDGAGTREFEMEFGADAFVFVEVEGGPGLERADAEPLTGVYAALLEGFTPLAFCNPIFVDADRDGTWRPLGRPMPPLPEP